MKLRVLVTALSVGLVGAALLTEAAAAPNVVLGRFEDGEKKKDDKKAAKEKKAGDKDKKPVKAQAGSLQRKIKLAPRGLQWGMSTEQVAKLYDKQFDKEFLPLYKKVEPGIKMQSLDAELSEKKAQIRRSRIEFGRLPTGVDQSALKGEYSYNNGESMAKVTMRSGGQRYFFFMTNKLWKVYDEHKLREGGPLGGSFDEAVKLLTKKLKVAPKMVQADFAANRSFDEAQWSDGDTIVRIINREPVAGVVYVDQDIQNNLAKYRRNKVEDPHALDRDVAAVTRKPEEPKAPEKDKGKAKPKSKSK
jgi:hypothetical protein